MCKLRLTSVRQPRRIQQEKSISREYMSLASLGQIVKINVESIEGSGYTCPNLAHARYFPPVGFITTKIS